MVTALSYYMQMWTIAKRGPVFLAMSMPLTFVFTILISSFIIGDAVSLGRLVQYVRVRVSYSSTALSSDYSLYCICSIFAGALLVGGLYNVFWGKSIEERDDLNKISAAAGKPGGLELPQQLDKADEASQEVQDDDAEAKV
jgi:hypothetical protein